MPWKRLPLRGGCCFFICVHIHLFPTVKSLRNFTCSFPREAARGRQLEGRPARGTERKDKYVNTFKEIANENEKKASETGEWNGNFWLIQLLQWIMVHGAGDAICYSNCYSPWQMWAIGKTSLENLSVNDWRIWIYTRSSIEYTMFNWHILNVVKS